MKFPTVFCWFILPLVVGILIWTWYAVFEPSTPHLSEPEYQGKKLTEWAREIDQADFLRLPARQQHPKQNAEAIAAIQHIGTNALPLALELCRAQDSWLKMKWETWIHRYNFPALEKHYEGQNIVWALGSATKPIVPELVQLLKSDDRNIVADTMFYMLPGAGTNAIPPLLALLNDTNAEVRLRAAVSLAGFFLPKMPASESNGLLIVSGSENFRSQAQAAIPVLLDGLEKQKLNLVERLQAVQALGLIHENAQTVVPILTRLLQTEPDAFVLRAGTNALKNFAPLITN